MGFSKALKKENFIKGVLRKFKDIAGTLKHLTFFSVVSHIFFAARDSCSLLFRGDLVPGILDPLQRSRLVGKGLGMEEGMEGKLLSFGISLENPFTGYEEMLTWFLELPSCPDTGLRSRRRAFIWKIA